MAQKVDVSRLVMALLLERATAFNLDLPDELTPDTKVNSARCGQVVVGDFHLSGIDLPEEEIRIRDLARQIPNDRLVHYTPPDAKEGRYRS